MAIIILGSMALDAIETPFGKTDKIIGGLQPILPMLSSHTATSTNFHCWQ